MNAKEIMKIFEDTAYVRVGGTDSELRCAKYLVDCCEKFGGKAYIEEFSVDMATIQEVVFEADGNIAFPPNLRKKGTIGGESTNGQGAAKFQPVSATGDGSPGGG